MRLAISNIAWSEEDDEIIYNFLKEHNVTGLEIAPTRIFKENPYEQLENAKKYSNMLKEKYNLNIASMQSIWFGKSENIFQSKSNAEELIKYTKKSIDFANAIGCGNLVFGCPKNRNINNYEEDYPKAINFFRSIGEYALNKNIVIAVEPNPVIYNTNFLNTTKEALNFVKEINLDSIKVNYDLGTVIYNEENIEIIKDNIKYINHIHISEPNLKIIEKRELHTKLIKLLNSLNYQRYVSIEMKNNENIDDVKKSIIYVKNLIGEIQNGI